MQESDDQSLSAADHPHANKKRKMRERVVVAVKIEGNVKKQQRNEGPPSDPWSWRKYGQKPIKGSPYPRGYYRCSTSKGCSAKKQVERCKTDSSMLIITYTSSHNHPLSQSPPTTNSRLTESRRPKIPSQEQETQPPSNPFEEIHQTPEAQPLKMEEENDFYDELEELPTSSFFTAFMKTSLCCKERIASL